MSIPLPQHRYNSKKIKEALLYYVILPRPITSPLRSYSLISTKSTQVDNTSLFTALATTNLLTKRFLTKRSAQGCFIGKHHASDYFIRLKVVSIVFNLRKKSVVCVLHTFTK